MMRGFGRWGSGPCEVRRQQTGEEGLRAPAPFEHAGTPNSFPNTFCIAEADEPAIQEVSWTHKFPPTLQEKKKKKSGDVSSSCVLLVHRDYDYINQPMNRNTLDASAVEAMRSSPTSIVEIDESLVPMTSPTNTRQIRADNEISPKLDMSDYRPSFRISCSPRTFRTLPTVEEVPGSAKQRARPIDSPTPSAAATDVSIDKNEVRKLNQSASFYALRGNEQMALKMYKKALSLATKEVSRIQRKMEKAMGEPDYLQKTIQQLLNDEWVEVALIIAEIKTMMAIIYERTGIYDRAIKCCNEARDVYERQMKRNAHQPEEEIFQQAQESATQMKHMAEKLLEADGSFHLRKGLHESCIKIHRELCRSKDPAVREMLFDTIYDNLSAVLALELQSLGKNHPEVAETLTFLSKLHLARNDKYKALISMERAVSVAEIALGNLHPRTAEKYYDLARQYETANRDRYDHENAVVFYEKAIEAYKEADGDFTRLVGTISNDIGVLLLRNGYHDSAIQRLSDALAFYGSSEDSQEVISADTAQVWRNLAECCVLRGEWESAVNNFTSALNVQRSARTLFDTVSPNNPGIAMPPLIHDESIADTLLCLGRAHSGNKNNKKAYQTFLEALTMLQNIPEVSSERNSNNDSPLGLAEKQDQVANAIFCLAQVQEAEMKLDEALKLYEEALELRTFSDTLRPKGKEANLIHCALCRAGIGSVRLHKNQYDLAFKAFNIALQNAQQHGTPLIPFLRFLRIKDSPLSLSLSCIFRIDGETPGS